MFSNTRLLIAEVTVLSLVNITIPVMVVDVVVLDYLMASKDISASLVHPWSEAPVEGVFDNSDRILKMREWVESRIPSVSREVERVVMEDYDVCELDIDSGNPTESPMRRLTSTMEVLVLETAVDGRWSTW